MDRSGIGEPGTPTRLATAFSLTEGRISRIVRHPDTAAALDEPGLVPPTS